MLGCEKTQMGHLLNQIRLHIKRLNSFAQSIKPRNKNNINQLFVKLY